MDLLSTSSCLGTESKTQLGFAARQQTESLNRNKMKILVQVKRFYASSSFMAELKQIGVAKISPKQFSPVIRSTWLQLWQLLSSPVHMVHIIVGIVTFFPSINETFIYSLFYTPSFSSLSHVTLCTRYWNIDCGKKIQEISKYFITALRNLKFLLVKVQKWVVLKLTCRLSHSCSSKCRPPLSSLSLCNRAKAFMYLYCMSVLLFANFYSFIGCVDSHVVMCCQ